MAFNPSDHLIALPGRGGAAQYLEVKWRLVWLRDRHPDALIETTPYAVDHEHAIVTARVSIPNGGSATGIGSESRQDFRDYIEKAETKAIGRALAALGFGTQFCDDFDTPVLRDGTPRIVDAPVQRQAQPPAPGLREVPRDSYSPQDLTRPATQKQISAIWAICKAQGFVKDSGDLDVDAFKGFLAAEFGDGYEDWPTISFGQASAVLDRYPPSGVRR